MGETAIAGANAGANVVNTGYEIYGDERDRNDAKRTRQVDEQESMRREASYRQNRALLINQIEDFYNKRGIPLPTEHAPGEGTTRPLPGDKNIYAGYDVDPSKQTHQPLDANGSPLPFDPNDPNSTVKQSEAQQALLLRQPSNNGVNLQQAQMSASHFKPVNQAKAMKASVAAQASAPDQLVSDPIVDSPQAQTPEVKPINATPTTALPQTLKSVGRKYGF